MNKTIKKIVALGVGASMLLGTAAMAMALDLSSYPAPFVANGVFVGKIVIGEKAMAIDNIGAMDISASLQRAATTMVSSTGASTQVAGGFRLDTAGDHVYYGQTFSIDSVTSDNLPLLADKEFDDSAGTAYKYTQSVTFAKSLSGGDKALSYGQHTLGSVDSFLGFDTTSATPTTGAAALYTAEVDFSKAINASNTNVIGQKIVLFGKELTFSSETDLSSNKIVLYGSSEEVSLTPKDDVTKTVAGTSYEVKVIGFSSDGSKATITVNGVTDSITEGVSKTIGGLKIFAKSISSWNNGIDGFATLQLGADKLILQDGQNVMVGADETTVQGTRVSLTGGAGALTSLKIWTNPTSDFKVLKEGTSFTDPTFGTFAVQYVDTNNGLSSDRDKVTVRTSGTLDASVTLTPAGGNEIQLPYAHEATAGSAPTMAASVSNPISVVEGSTARQDYYIYLTPGTATSTTTDAARYTHLVRVTGINQGSTQGKVTFRDVLTDAEYDSQQGSFLVSNSSTLPLTVDGFTYSVLLTDNNSGNEGIAVTYAGTTPATVVYPAITLKGGETFALLQNVTGISVANTSYVLLPTGVPGAAAAKSLAGNPTTYTAGGVTYTLGYTGANLVSVSPAIGATVLDQPTVLIKEDKDDQNTENVVATRLSYDSNGLNIVYAPTFTYATTGSGSMADSSMTTYLDYYGTYVEGYHPTGNNANVVTIHYPSAQMYANVFLAPTGATATSTSTSGAVSLNPISLGLGILDSDATLGSMPYIVVGGPCVNTVAMTLMGNPTDCTAGFSEGKAMIKLFADKNALLVAGYSGTDTQGAARVLASYTNPKYALTGTEVEVTSANLADLSIKTISN